MQVQKINVVSLDKKNPVRKTNYGKFPTFKGYCEVMDNVVKRDFIHIEHLSSAFLDLYNALKSTPRVKISSELALLEDNGFKSIPDFMKKICAPIAKVPSALRDIVFKTEYETITLLENKSVGSLMMCNFGKKGFWNSIFNSQDALNDIKFLFSSANNHNSFEIGINKKGKVHVEQINHPNWKEYDFGDYYCISEKTGTFDTTTPIWPAF